MAKNSTPNRPNKKVVINTEQFLEFSDEDDDISLNDLGYDSSLARSTAANTTASSSSAGSRENSIQENLENIDEELREQGKFLLLV